MAKIRTEVLIETSETFIVRRNRTVVRAWCAECAQEVSMGSLPEAAIFAGLDVEAINRLMEKRRIHFYYPKPETLSVCLRSLCLI
jgi:hypothetical protein